MLSYNEILPRKYVVIDSEPYEVLSAQTTKKSRQKASNQTRLRNIKTGKVVERAFHQSDNVEEADIDTKKITYIYTNRGESWFYEGDDKSNRFSLPESLISDKIKFIKENTQIDALLFNDDIIDIKIPIKVDLKVIESPPNVKGNTAQGGTKQVTLETGATVNTPLFIKEGDIIRINTDTGEYVERAR